MERSRTPLVIWSLAIAIAVSVAWFRVASVPAQGAEHPAYTWDSAVGEVKAELAATVAGLRH